MVDNDRKPLPLDWPHGYQKENGEDMHLIGQTRDGHIERLRARVAQLEAWRSAVLAYKDETNQCPNCGYEETWWRNSNADFAVRKIDAALANEKTHD